MRTPAAFVVIALGASSVAVAGPEVVPERAVIVGRVAEGAWTDPNGPHKGDADGRLDGFDLVIHMGHPRLKIEPLSEQSPATIDVLRWRRN